jgi:hypothetical protein
MGVEASGEDEEEGHKRSEGKNMAKKRKRWGVNAYKDELVSMAETKKAFAAE